MSSRPPSGLSRDGRLSAADDRVRRSAARSPGPTCPGSASASARCSSGAAPSVALCDVSGVDARRGDGRRARAAPARRAAARLPGPAAPRVGRAARARRLHGPRATSAGARPRYDSSRGGQAEEREERLGVEEERELDDPAVRDLEHLQRPRLVAARPSALGLYWPNAGEPFAAIVGIDARAAAAGARARPTSARMSSRPLQPEVVRRHRLRRVLVDQRRERVHVVALERLDVAREQLARRPRRRRRRRRSALTSLASSVARARWSALLTDATLVSRSSATSVAFQRSTSQRISTARWRGGRCCSAATNARRIVSRATATSAGSPSAARRGRPGSARSRSTSGSVLPIGPIGLPRGPEIHRPGAALPPVQHVEADVRRDAVEPRAQRRAALEAVEARARRGGTSPARRPRPRTASRASGSSRRSARARCCSSRSSSSPAVGLTVSDESCIPTIVRGHGPAPKRSQPRPNLAGRPQ